MNVCLQISSVSYLMRIGLKTELQQKTEPVHSNSIWSNLVSSTSITSSDADDKRKIHKCDFPSCDKVYTKSSHLKTHKREDPIHF